MSEVVLAAFLGAVFGALATFVITELRESHQRMREKCGLARLLLAEMERNSPDRPEPTLVVKETVDAKDIRHEVVSTYTESPPMLDSWREARTRLAQLLKPQDFIALADYYQILETLSDNATSHNVKRGEQKHSQVFISEEQRWKERTEDLQRRLRQYAKPSRAWLLGPDS